jgi:hypothetical protein
LVRAAGAGPVFQQLEAVVLSIKSPGFDPAIFFAVNIGPALFVYKPLA